MTPRAYVSKPACAYQAVESPGLPFAFLRPSFLPMPDHPNPNGAESSTSTRFLRHACPFPCQDPSPAPSVVLDDRDQQVFFYGDRRFAINGRIMMLVLVNLFALFILLLLLRLYLRYSRKQQGEDSEHGLQASDSPQSASKGLQPNAASTLLPQP
ncbi:hypothetical protein ACLOJK_031663 [Asimina triloba]